MGKRLSGWGSNPIAVLAVQRCGRSRWLLVWTIVPVLVAGPVALLFSQRPVFLTPVLQAILMGRLSSPVPGETFVLPIVLVAFLLLTVVGTVPRATLGIARERERRTLEPLLITRLSAGAILWGELWHVLLTPALASMALLPLMCLGWGMGSLSVGSILAALAVLLLCHLFFGAASLCASCWCRRTGVAMVLGYAWVLLVCGSTLLFWSWLHRPAGPNPWWVDGVLALNPVASLVNAIVPEKGVLMGSLEVRFALVGAGEYLSSSACSSWSWPRRGCGGARSAGSLVEQKKSPRPLRDLGEAKGSQDVMFDAGSILDQEAGVNSFVYQAIEGPFIHE